MRRSIGAFVIAFLLPACGGGGGGSAGSGLNTTPYSVTDASGDFAITLDVLSATEIRVRWEDPTARYALRPLSWSSTLYKNGVKIAEGMSGFSFTDAGLMPDMGYSYRATVTAWYQYLWSVISMGWASGTVSATTLYGLRVVNTSPGAGEVDIPPASPITATFNGSIDPESVTASSFQVAGPSGPVAGALSVSGSTVTFAPAAPFPRDVPLTVTLTTAVRDVAGFSLASEVAWTFTIRLTLSHLFGVWGSSGTDVFAVGGGGTILRFDGLSWAVMASGTGNALLDIWGRSGSDVFAVGEGGTILHYDGLGWSSMASPTTLRLAGVWGRPDGDVFAVGLSGAILRYDGYAWGLMASPTENHLEGVWGGSESDVLAVGLLGTVLRYDGASWTSMSSGTAADLRGVWGSSAGDVYAVGGHHPTDANVIHFDGTSWAGAPRTNSLSRVWGGSASDVFAVGIGIHRLTGSGAIPMYETPAFLSGVWGSSAADVWAVGAGGTILRYDGVEWTDAR